MSAMVRAAVLADLSAILELERSVAEAPHWSEAQYAEMLGDVEAHRVVLVAEDGEGIAGFSVASFVAGEAELEGIAVHLRARRKGIGKELLQRTASWGREREGTLIRLEVRASNAAARAFYTSLGFVDTGVRKNYYRNPVDDATLMEQVFPK